MTEPTRPTRSLLQGAPYTNADHTNLRESFNRWRAQQSETAALLAESIKANQNVKTLRRNK